MSNRKSLSARSSKPLLAALFMVFVTAAAAGAAGSANTGATSGSSGGAGGGSGATEPQTLKKKAGCTSTINGGCSMDCAGLNERDDHVDELYEAGCNDDCKEVKQEILRLAARLGSCVINPY